MIFFKSALLIFLFVTISKAVVITGFLQDSVSKAPLQNAQLTFRLGQPNQYPTALSDSLGRFRVIVTIAHNVSLQTFIQKTGYITKKIEVVISADSLSLAPCFMTALRESSVLFYGIVKDSMTNLPAVGDSISLIRYSGGSSSIVQKITTNSMGEFSITVVVSNDPDAQLIWVLRKTGYFSEDGDIAFTMDSVKQTILLNALGSIRISVKGMIVDSLTRLPVRNALVFVQASYPNVKPDSSFTNNNGAFKCFAEIGDGASEVIPTIGYRITASGYALKYDHQALHDRAPIDLATVAMFPVGLAARTGNHPQTRLQCAVHRSIFSVNGKLLYREQISTGKAKSARPTAFQLLFFKNELVHDAATTNAINGSFPMIQFYLKR